MNMDTAQRLFKYRKANAYSQEELANKIGVSRQAVSKWERGESSPDTDNLIALAKLYNISIDELINGVSEPAPAVNVVIEEADDYTDSSYTDNNSYNNTNDNKNKTHISFKNGIHVHDGDNHVDIDFTGIHVENNKGESVHIGSNHHIDVNGIDDKYIDKHHNVLNAVLCAGALIAYLIIGFTLERGWALGWLIIFIIPLIDTFVKAVKFKNPAIFAYPVLIVGLYLSVGMLKGIWHPTWIMFLTIPIYYAIASLFSTSNKNTKDEQKDSTDLNYNN